MICDAVRGCRPSEQERGLESDDFGGSKHPVNWGRGLQFMDKGQVWQSREKTGEKGNPRGKEGNAGDSGQRKKRGGASSESRSKRGAKVKGGAPLISDDLYWPGIMQAILLHCASINEWEFQVLWDERGSRNRERSPQKRD